MSPSTSSRSAEPIADGSPVVCTVLTQVDCKLVRAAEVRLEKCDRLRAAGDAERRAAGRAREARDQLVLGGSARRLDVLAHSTVEPLDDPGMHVLGQRGMATLVRRDRTERIAQLGRGGLRLI